jgi:hypothetical protein
LSGDCGASGGKKICTCIKKYAVKPEGRRTFGRPVPRWEGNIQMGLKEEDWTPEKWRLVVKRVMELGVP